MAMYRSSVSGESQYVEINSIDHDTHSINNVNNANIETGDPPTLVTYSNLIKGSFIINYRGATNTHSGDGRALIYKNETLMYTDVISNSEIVNNYHNFQVEDNDNITIKVGWINGHSDCNFSIYIDAYNAIISIN